MAFQKENVIYGRGKANNFGTPAGLIQHTYASANDTQATIAGASYFDDFLGATSEDVKVGDLIIVRDSVNTFKNYRVDTLSPMAVTSVVVDANPFDQSLNTTDAVTFATVDTGQGANELFGMDQTVKSISQVTFDKVTTTDGIVLPTTGGTPSTLSDYEVGTFTLNLTGGFVGTVNQSVDFVRIGNTVTLRFDFLSIPQTAPGVVVSGPDVPVRLRTSMGIQQMGRVVIDNTTPLSAKTGLGIDGVITIIRLDDANFTGAGNLNLQEGCLTYII